MSMCEGGAVRGALFDALPLRYLSAHAGAPDGARAVRKSRDTVRITAELVRAHFPPKAVETAEQQV